MFPEAGPAKYAVQILAGLHPISLEKKSYVFAGAFRTSDMTIFRAGGTFKIEDKNCTLIAFLLNEEAGQRSGPRSVTGLLSVNDSGELFTQIFAKYIDWKPVLLPLIILFSLF